MKWEYVCFFFKGPGVVRGAGSGGGVEGGGAEEEGSRYFETERWRTYTEERGELTRPDCFESLIWLSKQLHSYKEWHFTGREGKGEAICFLATSPPSPPFRCALGGRSKNYLVKIYIQLTLFGQLMYLFAQRECQFLIRIKVIQNKMESISFTFLMYPHFHVSSFTDINVRIFKCQHWLIQHWN